MRLSSYSSRYAGAIEVYDGAIHNSAEIVRYLERNAVWREARIGQNEGIADSSRRSNSVTSIDPFDFRCPDLLRQFTKVIWHYLDDYAQRYGTGFSGVEPVNVNRYGPGEFYGPHSDDGPGHNRIISALVYLNTIEFGGETEFIYQDVSVSPREGRLVIFPSNYAYTHAAHPPTSGIKYSAAVWTARP